jgi:hypothetical protein
LETLYCGGLTFTSIGIPLYSLPPLVRVRVYRSLVRLDAAPVPFAIVVLAGLIAVALVGYVGLLIAAIAIATYLGMPKAEYDANDIVVRQKLGFLAIPYFEFMTTTGDHRRGVWGTRVALMQVALEHAGIHIQFASSSA